MTDLLVVAAAQMESAFGDVAGNVATTVRMIREAAAAGVRLVVFPELSTIGYDLDQLADDRLWLTPDDPRLAPVAEACRETGVTAVIVAAWRDPSASGAGRIASFVYHPDGTAQVVAKMHVHASEDAWFQSAPYPPQPLDIDGWKVALAVCFDAANPTHALAACEAGADLYACSAMYDVSEIRRLDLHFGARAMDHRMVSLLANCTGAGKGWGSCGLSGTWGPDGERRTVAPDRMPQLVVDRIERATIERYRPARVTAADRQETRASRVTFA
ncbi:MAG: carbon-nitrogen hydrolase family protein [Thermomicrobiales bacterium]